MGSSPLGRQGARQGAPLPGHQQAGRGRVLGGREPRGRRVPAGRRAARAGHQFPCPAALRARGRQHGLGRDQGLVGGERARVRAAGREDAVVPQALPPRRGGLGGPGGEPAAVGGGLVQAAAGRGRAGRAGCPEDRGRGDCGEAGQGGQDEHEAHHDEGPAASLHCYGCRSGQWEAGDYSVRGEAAEGVLRRELRRL